MNQKTDNKKGGKKKIPEQADKVWKNHPPKGNKRVKQDVHGNEMHKGDYGKKNKTGWEKDHKKPKSKGGSDSLSNLQPMQWENNRDKGDKTQKKGKGGAGGKAQKKGKGGSGGKTQNKGKKGK